MKKAAVFAIAVSGLFCSLASAANTVIIRNDSKSAAYVVIQTETAVAPAPLDRKVREIPVNGSGSVGYATNKPDRLVIAYEPGSGGKLNRIHAVTVVTKDDYLTGGDAVLYLLNNGDDFYFQRRRFKATPAKVFGAAPITIERIIDEVDFKKLIEESAKNKFEDEKKK